MALYSGEISYAIFFKAFHLSNRIVTSPVQRAWRLLACLVLLGLAYQVAQWPPMRNMYSPWDKYAHAFAFFWVWWALRWSLSWQPMHLALVSAALGGAVEIHQIFLPGFTPSWGDWAADLGGISLALALWGAGVWWCGRLLLPRVGAAGAPGNNTR